MHGPVECVYREKAATIICERGKCFLLLFASLGKMGPLVWVQDRESGLVWIFAPINHWDCWESPDGCVEGDFHNSSLRVRM